MPAPNGRITRAAAYAVPYPLFGPLHIHPQDYQILYVVNAEDCDVRIGDVWHSARPEDLYVVQPGVVHESTDGPGAAPSLWEVKCQFGDAPSLPVDASALPAICTKVNDVALLDTFRRLIAEYNAAPSGWEYLCSHLLDELFFRIGRLGATAETPGKRSAAAELNKEAVSRAKAHIEVHFAEELDVPGLAATAGISTSHFAALFKQLYGRSPVDYLIEVRIDRAAKMLIEWQHTISEVAEATGFSSVHYFSRQFRKRRGVPPSEYRQAPPE